MGWNPFRKSFEKPAFVFQQPQGISVCCDHEFRPNRREILTPVGDFFPNPPREKDVYSIFRTEA
jgi:hypothetical protein